MTISRPKHVASIGERLLIALIQVLKISKCVMNLLVRISRCVRRTLWLHGIHLILLSTVVILLGISFQQFLGLRLPLFLNRTQMTYPCSNSTNLRLGKTSEFVRLNAAAATTLVTLLPALLTLAPFPIARIRHLVAYSTSAAMITSSMTFGLSTTNISTLAKDRIIRVRDLCMEATIIRYGQYIPPGRAVLSFSSEAEATSIRASGETLPHTHSSGHHPDTHAQRISELHELYLSDTDSPQQPNGLQVLRSRVLHDSHRPSRLQVMGMELEYLLVQISILVCLLVPMINMTYLDVFWSCSDRTESLSQWIAIMSLLAGTVRPFADSSFIHQREILHLHPAPPNFEARQCQNCSLVVVPPPQMPGISSNIISYFRTSLTRLQLMRGSRNISMISLLRLVFKGLFAQHSMVVIIQPSQVARPANFIRLAFRIFRGYVQAVLLIASTFLLGTTYDGDTFVSTIFISVSLTLVVISRTYSIYFCQWLEHALDASVIEYDTLTEFRAIQTTIAAMPGVIAKSVTKGYVYSEGYRLDRYNQCAVHDPVKQSTLDPLPIGCLSGLIVGLSVSIAMVMITKTILIAPGYSATRMTFVAAIAIGVVLGLFMCCKVFSNFAFIDPQPLRAMRAASDLEEAI